MGERRKIIGDRISVEKCLKWKVGSEKKISIKISISESEIIKIEDTVILLVKCNI